MLLSLYQSRFTGSKGAGGLETLGEMLGIQGLGDLQYQVLGLGDFETDGLDDINGLSGEDISIMGYEALQGLGAYLSGNSYEGESIALMDGLGRVRRAGVRRGHKITATPDAPQSAAAPAAPAEKKLGLYVPLNTLRNLFKLRAANLSRLQANGQTITPGSVPLSIDAMQVNGLMGNEYSSVDGLGWGWFNSMTANITNLASKAVNIASPMAQFLPGGSAISTLAKTGLSVIQKVNGSNTQLSRTQPVSQLLPTSPGRDYTTVYGEESAREYNRSMAASGLGSIPTVDSVITFVKANPIPVAVAAGAVGLGVYHFWPKGKASGKASGKAAGKTKKSRGKTAQYNMMGMS